MIKIHGLATDAQAKLHQCNNYCRAIMDDAELADIAKLLWEAPYGIVSHSLEDSHDNPT